MGSLSRVMAGALPPSLAPMTLMRSPCGMLKQARSYIGFRDTRMPSTPSPSHPMGVSWFPEGRTNRFECGVCPGNPVVFVSEFYSQGAEHERLVDTLYR